MRRRVAGWSALPPSPDRMRLNHSAGVSVDGAKDVRANC